MARDDVGNEARTTFIDRFTRRPVKTDRIRLSDAFMARVVPAIMDQTPSLKNQGSDLDNYLMINGELRRKNGETLEVPVTCRLDTAEEVAIYEAGGVLQRFAQDFLESAAAG